MPLGTRANSIKPCVKPLLTLDSVMLIAPSEETDTPSNILPGSRVATDSVCSAGPVATPSMISGICSCTSNNAVSATLFL